MILHHVMAPMEFIDREPQFRADLIRILSWQPDVIGLTEVGDRHLSMGQLAKEHGYKLVHPFRETGRPTTALMLGPHAELKRGGYKPIIPALNKPPAEGGHGERGITYAKMNWKGITVWVAVVHLITNGQTPSDGIRYQQNQKVLSVAARMGHMAAFGRAVSFIEGDFNRADKNLVIPGFTSMVDDVTDHPVLAIDTILRRDRDLRVETKRATRHEKQNSDHAPLSVLADIKA